MSSKDTSQNASEVRTKQLSAFLQRVTDVPTETHELSELIASMPEGAFRPVRHDLPGQEWMKWTKVEKDTRDQYKPSHPDVMVAEFKKTGGGDLKASKELRKGDKICDLTNITISEPSWGSLQVSCDQHIKFNSDLFYMNHSCCPNVGFSLSGGPDDWYAYALCDIASGDRLTFCYPATEFHMACAFDCRNSAEERGSCRKHIAGAASLPLSTLLEHREDWGVTDHVLTCKLMQLAVNSALDKESVISRTKELLHGTSDEVTDA